MTLTTPTQPDGLLVRRQALEGLGFACVSHDAQEVVLVRTAMMWEIGIRMSHVVRVRRLPAFDKQQALAGQRRFAADAGKLDPSVIPRGICQARTVLDVLLLDAPDEEARRLARQTARKGFGSVALLGVVEPDGTFTVADPFWGFAWAPRTRHICKVAGTGHATPESIAPLGLAVGLLVMWPSILALVLSCCGFPLALPLAALLFEKTPTPAALPGPAG